MADFRSSTRRLALSAPIALSARRGLRAVASPSLGALLLVAPLLACGGGGPSDNRCSASVTRDGKVASGVGPYKAEAQHSGCRAWCQAHGGIDVKDSSAVAGCASACGGDVMFGQATATVTCK